MIDMFQKISKVDQQVLQILIDKKLLHQDILKYLVNYLLRWKISALQGLKETHLLTETQIADAFAASLGLDRVYQPSQCTLADQSPSWLPFQVARKNHMIFLKKESSEGDDRPEDVELVCANPCDRKSIEMLQTSLNFKPQIAVSESREVLKAIDLLYPLEAQLPVTMCQDGGKRANP